MPKSWKTLNNYLDRNDCCEEITTCKLADADVFRPPSYGLSYKVKPSAQASFPDCMVTVPRSKCWSYCSYVWQLKISNWEGIYLHVLMPLWPFYFFPQFVYYSSYLPAPDVNEDFFAWFHLVSIRKAYGID